MCQALCQGDLEFYRIVDLIWKIWSCNTHITNLIISPGGMSDSVDILDAAIVINGVCEETEVLIAESRFQLKIISSLVSRGWQTRTHCALVSNRRSLQ